MRYNKSKFDDCQFKHGSIEKLMGGGDGMEPFLAWI